jgi:hypothetical protein
MSTENEEYESGEEDFEQPEEFTEEDLLKGDEQYGGISPVKQSLLNRDEDISDHPGDEILVKHLLREGDGGEKPEDESLVISNTNNINLGN